MVVDIDKITRELMENDEFETIGDYNFVKSLVKYNCTLFEDYLIGIKIEDEPKCLIYEKGLE